MREAVRVLSTPPTNTSSLQAANPPPEARAESVDSFSFQPSRTTGRTKRPPVALLGPLGCRQRLSSVSRVPGLSRGTTFRRLNMNTHHDRDGMPKIRFGSMSPHFQ
jgi:hypothetical protein